MSEIMEYMKAKYKSNDEGVKILGCVLIIIVLIGLLWLLSGWLASQLPHFGTDEVFIGSIIGGWLLFFIGLVYVDYRKFIRAKKRR